MNHDKETVLQAANGLWQPIIEAVAAIDSKVFNGKHQPCPICSGKDRFRYERKYDAPFLCNNCGPKFPLQFLMDYTSMDFSTAINTIGDYLNCVPVERIQAANQAAVITSSFPKWYQFDMDRYNKIKVEAKVNLSPWQRVNGLNMLDILAHGENALVPLLNESGSACDFILIDVDGNWETTGGNKSVPPGFHSVFGDVNGKHTYIAVSPYHAAHASIFMQRQVICCYDVANIRDVAFGPGKRPRVDISTTEGKVRAIECMERKPVDEVSIVVVTASMDDVLEADSLNFKQLTFNSKNNCVNRRLFEVGEIVKLKQEKENGK